MNQLTLRSLDYWFPTVIYKEISENFKQHNDHFKNKAIELKDKFKDTSDTNWKCDTFNTLGLYNPYQDNDATILTFIEESRKRVYDFSKKFGVSMPLESLTIKDFWFNVSVPDSYQEYHQHALSHFSVVYYVNAPKNCGNLTFQSFENITDMFTLPIEKNSSTELSYKSCAYEPLESMMLIFRSNLMHMVEKNLSGEDRISIAMNFTFKG
jgi:uncharacterized protein (TIGR02466 family)